MRIGTKILMGGMAALLAQASTPARAADAYDINVILPMTGGASFVGLGQKDTLTALATAPGIARAQASTTKRRLGVGFIGCGGRSDSHFQMVCMLRDEMKMPLDIVACCDIYRPRLEQKKQKYQVRKSYDNYQKLLEDPAVDLVCIATPDHHHASQALAAVKAGKHV